MKILVQTENGKIFKCSKCNAIHIEYKNLNFNLKEKEFKKFVRYVKEINGKDWENRNKDTDFNRKIIFPVGSGYFYALFNNEELGEFKQLLDFKGETMPCRRTIKAGNLEFTSIIN